MPTPPEPGHRRQGPVTDGHSVERAAAGLRRAAAQAGVTLPVDYARAVAADGLARSPQLTVSRLGAGIVVHTQPTSRRQLPVLLGYADPRGQWHRNGRRHTTVPDAPVGADPAGMSPVA